MAPSNPDYGDKNDIDISGVGWFGWIEVLCPHTQKNTESGFDTTCFLLGIRIQ